MHAMKLPTKPWTIVGMTIAMNFVVVLSLPSTRMIGIGITIAIIEPMFGMKLRRNVSTLKTTCARFEHRKASKRQQAIKRAR
eukprot:COSAG06_NODE_19519_length_834_cov_8.703401_1_plen_82_part_00